MSNVERKGDVFGFVERRGSALALRIILGLLGRIKGER